MEQTKPGFTRVFIPKRNRTIQILTEHANDHGYMTRHEMVLIAEPVAPPVSVPSVWQHEAEIPTTITTNEGDYMVLDFTDVSSISQNDYDLKAELISGAAERMSAPKPKQTQPKQTKSTK